MLIEHQSLTVGELNVEVPGCYNNVKTFTFDVKNGKHVYVLINSTDGIDACIVGTDGTSKIFVESVKNKILGPIPTEGKGTMMLVLGVYRGDLAHAEIEAWME